ncbi:unnamed protein product [Effrenium voratum]|nr:unnamed protein product [Effrenium voratum]
MALAWASVPGACRSGLAIGRASHEAGLKPRACKERCLPWLAVAVAAALPQTRRCRPRSRLMRPSVAEESGDDLIPAMPIGRLVSKGSTTGLEYDPFDAPEFIEDEMGGGTFSWMPVTAEGGLLPEGEYDEQSFEVPVDRLEYLQGSGFLQAKESEDYRAYFIGEVTEVHGRKWQRVVLKGRRDSVQEGGLRLMEGVLRRRPWDEPAKLPSPEDLKEPLLLPRA